MSKNFLLSIRVLIAALALVLLPLLPAAAQNATNVVIMLDLSGSMAPADLEQEREAARTLVNYFTDPAKNLRPKIAIGTFYEAYNEALKLNDFARIETAGLEENYARVHATITALSQRNGPRYTDLSAGIVEAQKLLDTAAKPANNYIILITDGVATKPVPPGANEYDCICGCPTSMDAARQAATLAKSSGSTIFTVYFSGGGSPEQCDANDFDAAISLLKNDLANVPENFYPGSSSLAGIFGQVACAISCDDGDPCTKDSCDANGGGVCVHSPDNSDTDGDTIRDCVDQCGGVDALLGTACTEITPIGGCSKSGQYICGPQGSLLCAATVPLNPVACYGCTQTSVAEARTSTAAALTKQNAAARSLAGRVKKLAKKNKKLSKQVSATVLELKKFDEQSKILLASIPEVINECKDFQSCSIVTTAATLSALSDVANRTQVLSNQLKSATRKYRKSLSKRDKALLNSMQGLFNAGVSALGTLPEKYNICS